jgi:hypothetical protein
MNPELPFNDSDISTNGRQGSVCLLADILPELLARYQVFDENEDGWFDPIVASELVACE